MFKFKNAEQAKPIAENENNLTEKSGNNQEKNSDLKKNRNHSKFATPTLQALALGTIMVGGVELGKKIFDDVNKSNQKTEKEIKIASSNANEYRIANSGNDKSNISKVLDENFISEIALMMKGDYEVNCLIKARGSVVSLINDKNLKMDETDSIRASKVLSDYNLKIKEEEKKLSAEDKKEAKEKIIDLMILVEKGKKEIIDHLQSDEYLSKLAKEMNISVEAAKEHQVVRISNIVNISYDFKNSGEIFMDTNGRGFAYYSYSNNKIVLPYDIDLNDQTIKDYFYNAIIHEILHESTRAIIGVSKKSKEFFEKSFKAKDRETTEDSIYFGNPAELIVRKQILDLEMQKANFKEYDENYFTPEHYKKLMILKNKNELSQGTKDLMDRLNQEDFIRMINELAEFKNNEKIYYHEGWDYNNKENLA